jgi:hypothetical protein
VPIVYKSGSLNLLELYGSVIDLYRSQTLSRGFRKEKGLIPVSRIKPTCSQVPALIGISWLTSKKEEAQKCLNARCSLKHHSKCIATSRKALLNIYLRITDKLQ